MKFFIFCTNYYYFYLKTIEIEILNLLFLFSFEYLYTGIMGQVTNIKSNNPNNPICILCNGQVTKSNSPNMQWSSIQKISTKLEIRKF